LGLDEVHVQVLPLKRTQPEVLLRGCHAIRMFSP
jgi:hypothetical protein